MKMIDITLEQLREAPWNPNRMDEAMLARLRASVHRYGVVQNLVVRALAGNVYEVLSGNQRLKVLQDLGVGTAPCVVVETDDARARLLSQALNRIQGEDDLGIRAELVREILAALPQDEILAVLPESSMSLSSLASMGAETLARHLQDWQKAQENRLRHLTFQLSDDQKRVVEEAMSRLTPQAKEMGQGSPNVRGVALYLLCKSYLEKESGSGSGG